MTKIALVLAIVAIGEGAVTLHLVNQLHEEREGAQALQARIAELERKAPPAAAGATFVAVPTQPAVSPFTSVQKDSAPPPSPAAVSGVITAAAPTVRLAPMPGSLAPAPALDQEHIREQMRASMERQRALLRDPEYREAMVMQQKMNVRESNPHLARDLDLSPEQADRLIATLAEQQMQAMENTTPWMAGEQSDPAKLQELQRKMVEQQRTNEAAVKRVLGEAKYREWQEYQSLSGVRWEADRLRSSLASAGVPLDESLTKPLLKTLQEQQQKMMQQAAAATSGSNSIVAAGGLRAGFIADGATAVNQVEMMERSLDYTAQYQKRQREALGQVLTPEQLKVIEEQHNNQLQIQRANLRMMRAQQEAGLLDPASNGVSFVREGPVTVAPSSAN